MPRRLRWVPPKHVVEVVTRIRDGQRLMAPQAFERPEDDLHTQLTGLIARYLKSHLGKCFAVHFASSHFHVLLEFPDAKRLSGFMRDFNGQAARLIKRLRPGVGEGSLWSRRYAHTVVLDEASAVARVEYIFAQAIDAHLCATPGQWPGLQSADALCRGEALEGTWFGYDRRNRLLKAGKEPPPPKRYTLELHPLPHLAHLPLAEQRAAYAKMEEDVILAAAHKRAGKPLPTLDALLALDPFFKPTKKLQRGPIPQWHVANTEAGRALRKEYREAYRAFVDLHRPLLAELANRLKAGLGPEGTLAWPSLAA